LFSSFEEQKLEHVDNNTSSLKLAEWKKNPKTRKAHNELFKNNELLAEITTTTFKSYQVKEILAMHWAYVLAIRDIVLNPRNLGIKCNDKAVLRRIGFLMVNNNVRSTLKFKNFNISQILMHNHPISNHLMTKLQLHLVKWRN
jgi:hypothetical protein